MGIDLAAKKAGIELQRDVPRKDQRTMKHIALLIGTCRKLEAHIAEEDRESHKKIEELSTRLVDLTEENAALQRELAALRLGAAMRRMELPEKDAVLLLGSIEEKKAG